MLRYILVVFAIVGLVQSVNQYFGQRVEGDAIINQTSVFLDAVAGQILTKEVELLLPVGMEIFCISWNSKMLK